VETGYGYSFTPLVEMLKISQQKNLSKYLNTFMYALFLYSFSFDPSLLWPSILSMAAIKGHARLLA